MQPKSILTLLAIAAFVMAAQANDYTWVGGAENHVTDWSWAANWDDQGTPSPPYYPNDSGDTATVGNQDYDPVLNDGGITELGTITINEDGVLTQSSTLTVGTLTVNTGGSIGVNAALNVATLTVDGTMTMNADVEVTSTCTVGGTITTGANTLEISGTGGMDIRSGGELEVNHASGTVVLSGGGEHVFTGTGYLKLWYSGSELSITSSNATVKPTGMSSAGSIFGENSGAVITVASGITLTNAINVVGSMEIHADSGTFVNNGLVEATRATETLTVYDGTIQGSCGGEFKVATSGATLLFRSTVSDIDETNMGCTFTQSAGTFDIDINIDTRGPCSGTFDLTDGTLDCCEGEDPCCPGCPGCP